MAAAAGSARYSPRAALQARADSIHNFQFATGQGRVLARKIWVRPYATATQLLANPDEPFVIDTLSTDVFDGRVLVVDYARRQLTLATSVPASLARQASFGPMGFKERRVLLNVVLQGQPQQLLFDSGSGAFALLNSQANWQQMARPAAPVHKVPVKL